MDEDLAPAFRKGSKADIVIGVIDEQVGGVVTNIETVPEFLMYYADEVFEYLNSDLSTPKALFVRYRPETMNEELRSRLNKLLDYYKGLYSLVESNKDFERQLYKLLLSHVLPLEAMPKLDLPLQEFGPHFGLGTSGQIASTPITSLDQQGNDLRRIDQLLPLVRECAEDFAGNSGQLGNQHPSLLRDVNRYLLAISAEVATIDWGIVWGLGVRLEAATAAAERRMSERLAPELEDGPLTALQSLRNLHAPLILATIEGRGLQEQADRMRMTRGDQKTLHDAAVILSDSLKQHKEIIEPETAIVVADAAETIGAEPHPERGTTYGVATLKNVTIVLFGAALATTPKFLLGNFLGNASTMGAWEALKKWPAFGKAAEALGKDFQALVAEEGALLQVAIERLMPFRAFIVANEQSLRTIAGATPQLRWLLPYIDYIVRTS